MGERLRWWHLVVFVGLVVCWLLLGCHENPAYYFGPGS